MSRSYRKAFIKERARNYSRTAVYWRQVRRSIKNKMKSYPWPIGSYVSRDDDRYATNQDGEMYLSNVIPNDTPYFEETLPDPRAIVNDYTYCDRIIPWEWWKEKQFDPYRIKNRRK